MKSLDSELLELFLVDLRGRGHAASSVRLRGEQISLAITWFRDQGILVASAIRSDDIDRYVASLRKRKLRNWTVKSHVAALRSFGRWLEASNLVLVDPAADLGVGRKRREEELPPRPLSEVQAVELLAAIEVPDVIGLRNRALTELLYACALRLGEGIGLNLIDLDMQQGAIRVHGKGGHQRRLPVLPGALAALRDYLALRRELVRGPDRGELFLGRDGTRLRAHTYRAWLERHCHKVLGMLVNPHLLRHSCAVHLLLRKADIRLIQHLLGHADLDTTQIYLRLLPDELRKEYEAALPVLMTRAHIAKITAPS